MQENIGVFTEHSVDKETTKNRRHSRRDNVSTNDAYTCVRFQDLRCGTYVNFEGLARVAIQGLTWVNF